MKPLANGEHVVEWSDGTREVFNVTGPKKDAMVTVGDEQMDISRYSMETPHGLVFFFPWEPEHRSFAFYDVPTATTAPSTTSDALRWMDCVRCGSRVNSAR